MRYSALALLAPGSKACAERDHDGDEDRRRIGNVRRDSDRDEGNTRGQRERD